MYLEGFKLWPVIFLRGSIKFLVMSHVAYFAPKYLYHFWGIRKELRVVSVIEKMITI
jgi:hypothetical protein